MYRILLILVTVLVVALAVGYGLRSSHKTSSAVTALLPRETVAFVHVPDLERTRDDWHQSDIYQLYREPSVQDFLRKPLSLAPGTDAVSRTTSELERLDPKDLFFAVTSAENDQPKIVTGFRFKGSQENAEKIIDGWRQNLLGTNGGATGPETVDYQQHKILVYRVAATTIGTVYTEHWFFAANNVEELKAVVDRADGRVTAPQTLLNADPVFVEAMANMPASYAVCFYMQPKTLSQKLAALRASAGRAIAADQSNLLAQIRSFCGATRFDGSKMHDVFFVGMPEQTMDAELTRNSIALASTDAFLYAATLLNLSAQFALVDPSPGAAFLGDRLQQIGRGLAAAGITAEQWKAVFGSEGSALADWPADNHWPATLIAFPVKDFAKAKQIASVLARVLDDDGQWAESDKNGVHYISTPYMAGFVALRPTIAVSEHFLVAGLDNTSVEAAMERANSRALNLANSAGYKRAAQTLPEPREMFMYLDLGLLYTRLDAALRPMLLMGAAFMPAMNTYAEVAKLPPPEIVAKHLSPVVSSQRYRNGGYIAESIGPITLSETGIGALIIAGASAYGYQHAGLSALGGAFGLPGGPQSGTSGATPAQAPMPIPSPTPSDTP
ncbi:MAG TPA: hypothetical protein VGG94_05500 [Chthoniobacterales bacterium]